MSNPRVSNGSLRRKYRARFRAMGAPCGICKGFYGEIHYDEPSDWKHPLSFVIDEIVPVSKYREGGYKSPRACAEDPNNLQPAHWACNAAKGNGDVRGKTKKKNNFCDQVAEQRKKIIFSDGDW